MILPADIDAALEWIVKCPCYDPKDCKLCKPAVDLIEQAGVHAMACYYDLITDLELCRMPPARMNMMSIIAEQVARRLQAAMILGNDHTEVIQFP